MSSSIRKKHGWSYRQTAACGHFGRDIFPWEQADMIKEIKAAAAKFIKKSKYIHSFK